MKKFFTQHCLLLLFAVIAGSGPLFSQNSILVNFGSSTCVETTNPSFSLIKSPLGISPFVTADCNLSAQLDDYFDVYIAYNPKDNKLYVADIGTGLETKIWLLDVGLPGNTICPPVIPVDPTYSYSYISNNFEFDNEGNLWSLNSYDNILGQCIINKIDVSSGDILDTRTVEFPVGHFPTSIFSGDITILPNGRMFATLGNGPSQLYEINNYNTGSGNATATYLQDIPLSTFGIAYLNGQLEITGTNGTSSCYYFDYDIANNILGNEKTFQNGLSPIDNTSITPAIGTTKQLVNTFLVNSNTADLTYEIYVRNMGNVIINNINVTDDLSEAFGAANISNISTSFVSGNNGASLILNANYNGTTITNLLQPGQQLPNLTINNTDYYFKIQVQCRVTNLNTETIYNNSAIGNGSLGNELDIVNVSDSSNNGSPEAIDPNNNGNSSDIDENVPTPFSFGKLTPVQFINVNALLLNNNSSLVKWKVATPIINGVAFEVEYSSNGRAWSTLGKININSDRRSDYQFEHRNMPAGNLYYRIKQTDKDGSYIYSRVVLLNNNKKGNSYVVFPNPANNFIRINAPYGITASSDITLLDATGRKLAAAKMDGNTIEVSTANLPGGTYFLKIKQADNSYTQKVLIMH